MNEATARLKINRLLERAGWRFFPEGSKLANVQLEAGVALKPSDLDGLGDDFEKTSTGFVDYLLLGRAGVPVHRAGGQVGKRSSLSLEKSRPGGTPTPRTAGSPCSPTGTCTTSGTWNEATPTSSHPFPTPGSVIGYSKVQPNPQRLVDEQVRDDYIVLTQTAQLRLGGCVARMNLSGRGSYEITTSASCVRTNSGRSMPCSRR